MPVAVVDVYSAGTGRPSAARPRNASWRSTRPATIHGPALAARRIGVVVSGGNVSARRFGEVLALAE
jgi:hypothetical protein